MNSKEYIEKYSEQMRQIRKKAAALSAAEERRIHEETRAKLKAARAAETPLSDEEVKEKIHSKERMTKEEIIENGTPEERAALVISDRDKNKAYGIPEELTPEDRKRLQAELSMRPQEERNVFLFYVKEYDRLCKYYLRLHNYAKAYQMEAALLAKLVTKWEDYDREAESCTKLYRTFQDSSLFTTSDGRVILTSEAEELELCYKENILKAHDNWKDATLIYDEATRSFKADIDGKGKLYEQIQTQAKDTSKSLSQFKAAAEVAESYIFEEVAYFVEPIQMENTIEAIKMENFIRYYGGPLKYFRSELNERKDNGETVSAEDEKRAVYPDYYEVEPNKKTLTFAKDYLLNCL